ncbi:alpha/beta hydrolase [Paraburkholderia phytofirmans OLGA172]|uniref:Alpha/beta hydrolase n=1 Tax=Paraburkholderia phytofirmans OLGA172 TaxID=1417228 RepID=A0A160FJJ0_9BURK|nr:alpha/beta hydrolase [Paraburkholderia phytofirmans]ANB72098.1 alpha/beta hydrolase [Paraburkholderia phytofirmans OLGA172]
MSVDQNIAAVLASVVEAGGKKIHESTPIEARSGYRALTFDSRTQEQVVPVGSVQDISVPGAVGQLRARVYRPEGEGPFPTIAFFHGGGFVIGDLDTHDNMSRDVCRGSRAVVVAVDYRLAPEHRFPAAVDDAVAATKWVAENAQRLGGNDTVAVAGDSAGGNLSAVVAQQLKADGIPLAGQFLIYPAVAQPDAVYPSRAENGAGYFLETESIEWFYSHYIGEQCNAKDSRLAPLHASQLSGLPPAVIVTAEFDPLRDEGEAYGHALRDAGVWAEVKRCEGMIHGFFDMGRWSPAAQEAIEENCKRFGDVLRES